MLHSTPVGSTRKLEAHRQVLYPAGGPAHQVWVPSEVRARRKVLDPAGVPAHRQVLDPAGGPDPASGTGLAIRGFRRKIEGPAGTPRPGTGFDPAGMDRRKAGAACRFRRVRL